MQFHLTPYERQVLLSELLNGAVNFDVASTMKQLLTHADLKAQLPAVYVSNQDYIEAAVAISCQHCFRFNPPVMLEFLDFLVQSGMTEADTLLRGRLLGPAPVVNLTHPLETELLYDRLAFANRTHLRQILRGMDAEANLKKILQIEGLSGSGRSWTSQLIEYHCSQTDGHLHCEESVTEDSGTAAGPAEVAKNLATKLGATTPCPPATSNEDAYIIDLAQWVIGAANEPQADLGGRRRRVWFVFDGFGEGVVREDTAGFLVALARHCTTGVAAELHRVVFCEFGHDVASQIKLKVETYDVEPLTRADLRQVIHSVVSGNPNFPAADHDRVSDETLEMVAGNQPGPFVDLREIGDRLQGAIEEIRA